MRTRRSTSLAALAATALAGVLVAPGWSAYSAPTAAATTTPTTTPTTISAPAPTLLAGSLGSLAVAPTRFVSGQSLTWSGKLSHRGVRTITMQRFLNRPGDSWIDVQGFSAKTKADGSFSFHYPAPDMMNIGFRVHSGRYATKKLDLYPKTQDVVLLRPKGGVRTGQPFTIVADTTSSGAPVFQGRSLTLQRRVSPKKWSTIGTTTVDASGQGTFSGLTETSVGTAVFRVREEDWTKGRNQVGWYPSFPTYVDVTATASPTTRGLVAAPAPAAQTADGPADATADDPPLVQLARTGTRSTAALRWKWGYPIFDFDWTSGESLSSQPWRGSRQRGVWTEYLGGTGRVAKRSGQLGVWSGRTDGYGSGNRGTTAATLKGNAQRYGRWELKLRTATRGSGPHYLVRAELVPERARDYDCGAHNITIAEIRQGQSDALIGAVKGTKQWTRTVKLGNIENSAPAVAVELMNDHVTWFVNSVPVGVLKKRRVTGGVPMTPRLSLIGTDDREMANTVLLSDWQRGFPINRSKGVLKAPALTRSRHPSSCGA